MTSLDAIDFDDFLEGIVDDIIENLPLDKQIYYKNLRNKSLTIFDFPNDKKQSKIYQPLDFDYVFFRGCLCLRQDLIHYGVDFDNFEAFLNELKPKIKNPFKIWIKQYFFHILDTVTNEKIRFRHSYPQ